MLEWYLQTDIYVTCSNIKRKSEKLYLTRGRFPMQQRIRQIVYVNNNSKMILPVNFREATTPVAKRKYETCKPDNTCVFHAKPDYSITNLKKAITVILYFTLFKSKLYRYVYASFLLANASVTGNENCYFQGKATMRAKHSKKDNNQPAFLDCYKYSLRDKNVRSRYRFHRKLVTSFLTPS